MSAVKKTTLTAAIAAIALSVSAFAESRTIITRDGKTFKQAEVVSSDETNARVSYEDGIETVPLENLPADIQKELKYVPLAERFSGDAKVDSGDYAKVEKANAAYRARLAKEAQESADPPTKVQITVSREMEKEAVATLSEKEPIQGDATLSLDNALRPTKRDGIYYTIGITGILIACILPFWLHCKKAIGGFGSILICCTLIGITKWISDPFEPASRKAERAQERAEREPDRNRNPILGNVSLVDWRYSSEETKLATCAHWISAWQNAGLTTKQYDSLSEVRADAIELRATLNIALQALDESEKVNPYASLCAIELGIVRKQ